MTKVVILGPAHPLRGGLASFDERLAKAFISKGHECSIYTFSLQYPSFLFPGTTQYSSEPAPQGLDIHVCVNSVNPFNWIKIGKILIKIKPDTLVVRFWLPFMGPCLGSILRYVRRNHHTRIICIADNVIPHEHRVGDSMLTRYFIGVPHAFITMSEKVRSDLKKFRPEVPERCVAHPLYDNFGEKIDKFTARQKLGIDPGIRLCLFFGFIRKYKGLDLLLEAFAGKFLKNADIHLLVAGEYYEDSKFYLDIIEKNNIQEKVILRTNFIPDSEVKYYLSAADVVVQPYREATQSGVTPLAYHFEVPMIVTNVGALPQLVPHGEVGRVCEPEPEAIENAIAAFFNMDSLKLMEGILREKKKLSWDTLVESIMSLSNDLEK
ncbi:MAG: glycosyltransferase [Saprospiraceae bacterium]